MNRIFNKGIGKLFLFLFAVLLGLASLIYTQGLVSSLQTEERRKVETWAEAIRQINSADTTQNLEFLQSIIENNNTVPVILTDGHDNIIAARNFEPVKMEDPGYLRLQLEGIREEYDPIVIDVGSGFINRIYYRDSLILTRLIYYPFVQLALIIIFIVVSYMALSSSRRADQNKLWVAMSKETAHQLGTPTSSLSGWIEILQDRHPDIAITRELELDVKRLEKVTERFSRIGSKPALRPENIAAIIVRSVEYLKSRTSSKVNFNLNFDREKEVLAPVNPALFEWVIENICKNAIDAMEGSGDITIRILPGEKTIIDISDTGRGIPKRAFRKIFNPGFTTKKRGWGMGLSLAKRIIEEYHNGKIFVRSSEPGKGSCIRIVMNSKEA